MQRVPLAFSCVLRSKSSIFGGSPAAMFAIREYANTPTAAHVVQPIPDLHHAKQFKLERQIFIASLPLLPLSYFVHGTTMDWLLTAAIVANGHFGAHAVITDYARPLIVGDTVAKLSNKAGYVLSALLLAGLAHFNYNDVGLTRAFEMVFAL